VHDPPPVPDDDRPFWKRLRLDELTAEQWEQLCDGCGKCCLEKLEAPDTGEIAFTDVACRLLDLGTCRCRHYADRKRHIPNCERLTPESVRQFAWLPSTCSYRLLSEGRDLPWWHHLVSCDRSLVHAVGASTRGRAVARSRAGRLEHRIVSWPA
jgi:hypothetical protein